MNKTKITSNRIKEKILYLLEINLEVLQDLNILRVLKLYYHYNDNNEFVEVSKEIDDKITKKIPNRTINLYNSEHSAFIKTLNIGKVYSMDKITDVNIEKAKEILALLGECDEEELDKKLLSEINMDFEYGYCDKIQKNSEYYIQKEFKLFSSYVNGDKEVVVKLTKEILDEKYRLISSEFLVYPLYLESSKEEFGNELDDVVGLVREDDLVSVVKDVVAPECHGVYCLIKDGEVVYIGKSNNLKTRERQHSVDENKDYNSVAYIVFKHPEMIHDYERVLIKSIKPKLNKQFLK